MRLKSAYPAATLGKCPHCQVQNRFDLVEWQIAIDIPVDFDLDELTSDMSEVIISGEHQSLRIDASACANCGKPILMAQVCERAPRGKPGSKWLPVEAVVIWPIGGSRPTLPPETPEDIRADFDEAAAVLPISPKSSAALSRRLLQRILRDEGNATQKDLVHQINQVLPDLPRYIRHHVDAIRHLGNFATHPLKHQVTGEIVDVEPGEAEGNLTALELLIDFYYVDPVRARAKVDALNDKLAGYGKPPLKGTDDLPPAPDTTD